MMFRGNCKEFMMKRDLSRKNRRDLIRWQRALLSGKYEQGKEKLCTLKEGGSKEYCCLGVLALTLGDRARVGTFGNKIHNWDTLDGETTATSSCICDGKKFACHKALVRLWSLNDREGWSFEKISYVLEVVYYFGFHLTWEKTVALAEDLYTSEYELKVHKISLH